MFLLVSMEIYSMLLVFRLCPHSLSSKITTESTDVPMKNVLMNSACFHVLVAMRMLLMQNTENVPRTWPVRADAFFAPLAG